MVGFILVSSSRATAESPEEALTRLEKARAEVKTLRFEATTTVVDGDITRESTAKTLERIHEGKRHSRVESRTKVRAKGGGDSSAQSRSVSVIDGDWEWREVPVGGTTMVVKARPTAKNEFSRAREWMQKGQAKIKGHEKIEDESCLVLEIGPKDKEKGRTDAIQATYWISERYGLIMKSRVVLGEGNRIEMKVTEFAAGESLPADAFTYTPPPGAKVIEGDFPTRTEKRSTP